MKWGDKMTFDDITIRQNGNIYELCNSLGYSTMLVSMPVDAQYYLDAKVLSTIAKTLSLRWKQKQTSKENKLASFGYSGMGILQIGKSEYGIYLPNAQQIAWVYLPPDNNYIDDDKCLKILCKCLGLRYGIK